MQRRAGGDHGVAADGDGRPRVLLDFGRVVGQSDEIPTQASVCLHDNPSSEDDVWRAFDLRAARDLVARVLYPALSATLPATS